MDRVLLVEDDRITNLELHCFLSDAGFDVEATHSGRGAVAAIKRQPPRYLVTDLDLGPGPDGFEVARYARERRSDTRIVIASGEPEGRCVPGIVPRAQFVPKPFRGEQIVDALRRPPVAG